MPYRQWTLSYPKPIRFLLARNPNFIAPVLQIFLRAIFAWQRRAARKIVVDKTIRLETGAVTFIQRFGSSVNLHVHFHAVLPDGVFTKGDDGLHFHPDAVAGAAHAAAALLHAQPTGFTISQFREALGNTRKHAVPLAAELDATGVTRRRDDVRIAGPKLPTIS